MGGNMSRDKGQRGEREVCALLQPVVNDVYGRLGVQPVPTLERNLMQSRSGGFDIAGLEWIALEVKRHETLNVQAWWSQTKEQAKTTLVYGGQKGLRAGTAHVRVQAREPVLLYRQNRGKWNVRMYGRLETSDGHFVKTPVTISLEAFLVWFSKELEARLQKGQTASAA